MRARVQTYPIGAVNEDSESRKHQKRDERLPKLPGFMLMCCCYLCVQVSMCCCYICVSKRTHSIVREHILLLSMCSGFNVLLLSMCSRCVSCRIVREHIL